MDIRVLIVTSEWPSYPGDISGIHVANQVNCLRGLGIRVDIFNFRGMKNPLNYLAAIRKFKKLDLSHYHLIHAHHGQAGVVALSQKRLPVVVTFHGSDLQGIRDSEGNITLVGRVLRYASRTVAKLADEVILVSEHLGAHIAAREYHVIPMGIDADLFKKLPPEKAREELSLPLKLPLVLFIGDPKRTEKRFWLAQQAIEQLKNRIEVELVTAAGVPHELIPVYMNACDVLLITSSTEGSPTIVKEALACRLPVVSVDVGDIHRQIGTIEACAICEDDAPQTIAAQLFRVLSPRNRIPGNQALVEIDERSLAQQVVQVYQNLIVKSKAK